jgi:hypothetical protein
MTKRRAGHFAVCAKDNPAKEKKIDVPKCTCGDKTGQLHPSEAFCSLKYAKL